MPMVKPRIFVLSSMREKAALMCLSEGILNVSKEFREEGDGRRRRWQKKEMAEEGDGRRK
jgi:hypothetical protein